MRDNDLWLAWTLLTFFAAIAATMLTIAIYHEWHRDKMAKEAVRRESLGNEDLLRDDLCVRFDAEGGFRLEKKP